MSSLLCGLAGSLETLVLYRVGQGLFGAPIMPMGQAILLATFPRHLHPLVMMIWGFGSVIGPVVGPILGSMIAEAYDWRGAFFMIVPPGIAALVCIWFALSDHTERTRAAFDWTGFLALSIAIAAAQLIMDRGQRLDWFEFHGNPHRGRASPSSASGSSSSTRLTAARPFLDPRLLLDRNFSIGLIISFVMGMLSFTPLVLFPEPAARPARLSRQSRRPAAGGARHRQLAGVSHRRAVHDAAIRGSRSRPGCVAGRRPAWLMAQLDINVSSFDVFWMNVLQGFGFGLAFTPMTVLAFATLPAQPA